jgi:hypothetical protein
MLLNTAIKFMESLGSKDVEEVKDLLSPNCSWILNGHIESLQDRGECIEYLQKVFRAYPNKIFRLTNPTQNTPNEISLDYHLVPLSHAMSQLKPTTRIGRLILNITDDSITKIMTYPNNHEAPANRKPSPTKPKPTKPKPTNKKQSKNTKKSPPPALSYDPITGLPL